MIVNTTVEGRKATVAYLHSDWTLSEPADADLLKVVFEDGGVLFLKPARMQARDYDPDQPRDPAGSSSGGQWTGSGSKSSAKGKGATASSKGAIEAKGKARHVLQLRERIGKTPEERAKFYTDLKRSGAPHAGRSYTANAVVDDNGVIHTDDVTDVARALYEGKDVNLVQAEKVSVVIDYIGKVASKMAKMGGEQKVFDLCRATVEGTNLFCADTKGIPRVEMPQLKGVPKPGSPASRMAGDVRGEVDVNAAFRAHLEKLGYEIEDTEVRADHMKATQNELDGAKIASIANSIRGTPGAWPYIEAALFVSDDNYVVDGHHRWAAKIGVDYDDGKGGEVKQPVQRVNAPITALLELSLAFAEEMGIPQVGVAAVAKEKVKAKDYNPDPNYTKGEGGLFTGSLPGQGSGEGAGTAAKVGGDAWNRQTAVRLEREYRAVKPAVQSTLDRLLAASAAVPKSWEQLSPEKQAAAQAAFTAKIKPLGKMLTPPESVWERFTPEQKFYYAERERAHAFIPHIEEPTHYDPLGVYPQRETQGRLLSGQDYERTQQIATHLSEARAVERLSAAGLPADQGRVRAADSRLWTGWVDNGSTSADGMILQLASAEELGSRFRIGDVTNLPVQVEEAFELKPKTEEEYVAALKRYADKVYLPIGGYKGVKEIVRAKWETTQFLLDKANTDSLTLYRGLVISGLDDAVSTGDQPIDTSSGAQKLVEIDLERNGAQSTTVNSMVANGWDGDADRVVLRVRVPRTAAISVPAYGENEWQEREVVVAGTAWEAWDAWRRGAPDVGQVPFADADYA